MGAHGNLATLLEEASELGRGLPRYVERDFARYLECGVLAHGFARVRLPSAAFLCLSAPPAALDIAPIPLMRRWTERHT